MGRFIYPVVSLDKLSKVNSECPAWIKYWLLKKTKNHYVPSNYVEGTSLNLTNSGPYKPIDFQILGNSKQFTTTGSQLWDYYSYPISTEKNGITITNHGDGTLTLNGTATSTCQLDMGSSSLVKQYNVAGSVCHKAEYISGTCTKVSTSDKRCVIRLNYNFASNTMIPLEQLQSQGTIKCTAGQRDESYTGWSWNIYIDQGDIFNNLKFRYQFNTGTADLPWEEYTGRIASPNPSYPQAINSVGDNVNLFDKDTMVGNIFINSSGTIYVNSSGRKGFIMACEPNTTYTINKSIVTNAFRLGYSENLLTDGDSVSGFLSSDNTSTVTITTGSNSHYLYCYFKSNTDTEAQETTILNNCKVEKGTQASAYSPYNMGSIAIEKCNKNLFDKNNVTILTGYLADSGKFVEQTNYKTAIMRCKPRTTYTISKMQSNFFRVAEFSSIPSANMEYITRIKNDSATSITFTTTTGTYLAINFKNPSDTSTEQQILDTIQVELGNQATTYIAHQGKTYIIPTQNPFRKIGNVADDFIRQAGKLYERHKFGRKVFDGSEAWGRSTTYVGSFYLVSGLPNVAHAYLDLLCNYFTRANINQASQISSNYEPYTCFVETETGTIDCWWVNESATSGEFRTWLSTHNVEVIYELKEPILIECTPEQVAVLEEIINDKLYEGETNYNSSDPVPPYLKVKYYTLESEE